MINLLRWKSVRVVECAGLENRYVLNGIMGSNPISSAKIDYVDPLGGSSLFYAKKQRVQQYHTFKKTKADYGFRFFNKNACRNNNFYLLFSK